MRRLALTAALLMAVATVQPTAVAAPHPHAVTSGNARFDVLSPTLVRTEYAGDTHFQPSATVGTYYQNVMANPPPQVTVMYPNGGEDLDVGSNVNLMWSATDNSAVVSVSRHDASTQRVDSLLVRLADGGVRTWPVHIRYSYPGELDQMADGAGLRLEERWGGWEREPFTGDSIKHVSVYAAASAE